MTKRTCTNPECSNELTPSRGQRERLYCSSKCSSRAWYLRNGHDVLERQKQSRYEARAELERKCEWCESPIPPSMTRAAKFCSKKCGGEAWASANADMLRERARQSYARRKDDINSALRAETLKRRAAVERHCEHCGEDIPPERAMSAKFCSRKCSQRAYPKDNLSIQCSDPNCDRPVRAKGVCSMHYKRILRSEGRMVDEPWSDRRRANYQKRRALKKGADAESVSSAEVFERDDWTCGICSERVNRSLEWPDPMSASLDHILPLSIGGSHTLANVQCAHLSCNVQKGNRVAA